VQSGDILECEYKGIISVEKGVVQGILEQRKVMQGEVTPLFGVNIQGTSPLTKLH